MKTLLTVTVLVLFPLAVWAYPLGGQTFHLIRSPFSAAELATLTALHTGDNMKSEDIDTAEGHLLSLGIWKTLSVTTHHEDGRLVLDWEAEAFPLIREIYFSGNHMILEKRLKRLLNIRVGDAYDPDHAKEDAEEIKQLYEDEGYFGTTVTAEAAYDSNGNISLTFDIDRGQTYLWGNFTCSGNTAFSCANIANRIRDLLHYRPIQLQESLKKLKESYEEKGFPNSRIEAPVVRFDAEKKMAQIHLTIHEGTPIQVRFSGNHFFSDEKLLTLSRLMERVGRASSFQARMAKERLEQVYREYGFPDALVAVDRDLSKPKKELLFTIQEGMRSSVKQIRFPGRKKLSKDTLMEGLLARESTPLAPAFFNPELLPFDQERIEQNYESRGFLDASVSKAELHYSPLRDKVTIAFPIEEGPQYRIEAVLFRGNHYFNEQSLLKLGKLDTGDKAGEKNLLKAKERILREYSKNGYPYAEIKINKIPKTAPLVEIAVEIDEGPRVILSQILILGHFRTDVSAILNAFTVRVGEPLNLPALIDGELALRHFNSYQNISMDIIGLKEKAREVTALIRLEERPELANEIKLSFDSDKLFSGKYSLRKRSLFGTGQQLQLDLEGGAELSAASLTHSIPQLRGKDWDLSETVFLEYEDDENFNALGLGTGVFAVRDLRSWLSWTIHPSIEYTDVRYIDASAVNANRLAEDSTIAALESSISIDRRDRYSDPKNGYMSVIGTGYNQDLDRLDNGFFTSRLQFAWFRELFPRIGLWHNMRVDRIFTVKSATDIPIQNLLFLGGNDTVRGFDEDAVRTKGGTLRLFHNTEIHLRLVDHVKLAGFLDSGVLVDEFGEIDRGTIRHSAGPGLRYFTPVGPLRLDYGFILDRESNEPKRRLHFSFGFFF